MCFQKPHPCFGWMERSTRTRRRLWMNEESRDKKSTETWWTDWLTDWLGCQGKKSRQRIELWAAREVLCLSLPPSLSLSLSDSRRQLGLLCTTQQQKRQLWNTLLAGPLVLLWLTHSPFHLYVLLAFTFTSTKRVSPLTTVTTHWKRDWLPLEYESSLRVVMYGPSSSW